MIKIPRVLWHHGSCDCCGKVHILVLHFGYDTQSNRDYRICLRCLDKYKEIIDDVPDAVTMKDRVYRRERNARKIKQHPFKEIQVKKVPVQIRLRGKDGKTYFLKGTKIVKK